VSAFQKVATFKINGGQKQGGNVASYFCTPEGRVLHAVAGPVNANIFLREARWAHETYQLAHLAGDPTPAELQAFFRKAHLDRLSSEHHLSLPADRLPATETVTGKQLDALLIANGHLHLINQAKVHLVLGAAALPRIDQVYQTVFETILNEKISTQPVRVVGR